MRNLQGYISRVPSGNSGVVIRKDRRVGVLMPPREGDISFLGGEGREEYEGIHLPAMMWSYTPRFGVNPDRWTHKLYMMNEEGEVSHWTGGNVYDDASTCWGGEATPLDPLSANISFWESSFNADLVEIPSNMYTSYEDWMSQHGDDVKRPVQVWREAASLMLEWNCLAVDSVMRGVVLGADPDLMYIIGEKLDTQGGREVKRVMTLLAKASERMRDLTERKVGISETINGLDSIVCNYDDTRSGATQRMINKAAKRGVDMNAYLKSRMGVAGSPWHNARSKLERIRVLRERVSNWMYEKRVASATFCDYAKAASYFTNIWSRYFSFRYMVEDPRYPRPERALKCWLASQGYLNADFVDYRVRGLSVEELRCLRSITRRVARYKAADYWDGWMQAYNYFKRSEWAEVMRGIWKNERYIDMASWHDPRKVVFGTTKAEDFPEVHEGCFGFAEMSANTMERCAMSVRGLWSVMNDEGLLSKDTERVKEKYSCDDCGHAYGDEIEDENGYEEMCCESCGHVQQLPGYLTIARGQVFPLWEMPDRSLIAKVEDYYIRGVKIEEYYPGWSASNINEVTYAWGVVGKETA